MLGALVLGSCHGGADRSRLVESPLPPGYADSLAAYRARVDAYFRSADSPLPDSARSGFAGLPYYPADPEWRMVVRPEPAETPEPITLLDTLGNLRQYTVHARLKLAYRDRGFTLLVYRAPAGHLFLPFRDRTSGEETYEVGRYLELREGPEPGTVIVDFNYAKNPYCAYSEDWACPLVPEPNHVDLAVRAGERFIGDGH